MRYLAFLAIAAIALTATTSFAGIKRLRGTFIFDVGLINAFKSDGGYSYQGAVRIDGRGRIKGTANVIAPHDSATSAVEEYTVALRGKVRDIGRSRRNVSVKITSSDRAVFNASYKKLGSTYYYTGGRSKLGSYTLSDDFLFDY